nr:hypothetical protein GCM10020063_029630 [Dactylosporangium thailandense]
MSVLTDHGIVDAGDPLLHESGAPLDPDAFFDGSARLLRRVGDHVRDVVIPSLCGRNGRWHPTGFMVYPLGAHPVFGTLRLHIWPAGTRRRVIQGRGDLGPIHDGDIHDHAWNITSLVLTEYHDNIYSVGAATGVASDEELFRRFSVAYRPGSYQSLVTDGSQVLARAVEHRVVGGGEIHTIRAGVFHAPVVPLDVTGATLVLSSPRVQATGPNVLIGGVGDAVMGARTPVTVRDAQAARDQLMSAA